MTNKKNRMRIAWGLIIVGGLAFLGFNFTNLAIQYYYPSVIPSTIAVIMLVAGVKMLMR